MREQDFLDLARINVGAARDIHVGFAARDVKQAAIIHAAEVARMEPAAPQRLGGRIRIAVVAFEHRRAACANFADFASGEFTALVVQDRDFHSRTHEPARTDMRVGIAVVRRMHVRGQEGDVAGHFAKPEILNQNLAEFLQGELLVGAVHGRPGVDHVAQ